MSFSAAKQTPRSAPTAPFRPVERCHEVQCVYVFEKPAVPESSRMPVQTLSVDDRAPAIERLHSVLESSGLCAAVARTGLPLRIQHHVWLI